MAIKLYIDESFCESLQKSKPPTDIEIDGEVIDTWWHVINLIKKHSITVLLSDSSIINSYDLRKENPIFQYLVSQRQEGHQNIEHYTPPLDYSAISNNVIPFILSNSRANIGFSGYKMGIQSFKAKSIINKWQPFTKPNVLNIEKSVDFMGTSDNPMMLKSWSDIAIYKHQLNSIIIADNHILSEISLLENNLLSILGELLPEKDLDIPIHITIFTSDEDNSGNSKNSNFKLIEDKIRKYLTTDLKLNLFKLSVFVKSSKKFHNRRIFTNYFIITSDNTFNYFDQKGKPRLDSKLTFIPYTGITQGNTFWQLYSSELSMLEEITKHPLSMEGDTFINRLFELGK
jgi:hypothetical protein